MAVGGALTIAAAAVLAAGAGNLISRFLVDKAFVPDRPTIRSSHAKTTPRSGGVAIVTAYFLAMLIVIIATPDALAAYAPSLCCALAAFAFGVADDFRPIGAKLKLAIQLLIAIAFVWLTGPVQNIPLPIIGEISLGAAAIPLSVLWIVAFMNVYNFMDGVNGIAAACAIFVLCAIAVAASSPSFAVPGVIALLLGSAIFGFLPLNYPAGRIFMGDGGSQFIGFMIAALAISLSGSSIVATSPIFVPLAFMPFIFDVAFTLAHRISRRRNIFQAHNEHIYQLLVRLGRSHRSVTAIYLALTVLSTSVAVIANAMDPGWQPIAGIFVAAAFMPLALAVYRRALASGLISGADGDPALDGRSVKQRAAAE